MKANGMKSSRTNMNKSKGKIESNAPCSNADIPLAGLILATIGLMSSDYYIRPR